MTLQVGATINHDNFIHVTPGSVITYSQYRARVLTNGCAIYIAEPYENTVYPLFQMSGWTVAEAGEWEPVKDNLAAFLQRVRTTCIGAALQHGVSREPVRAALRALGADRVDPPLGVGMWVHRNDTPLRERLERSGVVAGLGDPNQWEGYTEYRRGAVGGTPRMGSVRGVLPVMKVLHLDNPETDEYTHPATEEDEQRIAELRGQIWTTGVSAKAQNGWCSAYEQAVGMLGISRECTTAIRAEVRAEVPDEVAPGLPTPTRRASDGVAIVDGQARQGEYPDGAVFEFGNNGEPITDYGAAGHWNWMRKVPENLRHRPDFGSGTRHYIGPNQGDYGGNCRLLWDGVSDMRIPITMSLMPRLPEGTVIGDSAGLGVRYVKQENGTWRHETNGAPATDSGFFGITQQQNGTPSTTWFILELPTEHPGMPAPRR